jgi:hypothetical protein
MTLSPDEAADALRDIAAVETHSRRVYGYRQASPHLILWGVLWAVGYGLTAVWPYLSKPIWVALVAIGLAAGFLISVRATRQVADASRPRPRVYWRFPAIALTGLVFIAAALAVLAPVTGRQVGAFIPLVVAASYAVMGLWLGLRFTIAGAVLAILTLCGFFLLSAHFALWMAAVGGGALILAGFWLRQV